MLINGKFRCAGCMKELDNEFATCECGYNNDTDSNPPHCLQTGGNLLDEYVIGRVIGEGGFGITYVGWDKNLDVKVAIKEFYMSGCSSRNVTVSTEVLSSIGADGELFAKNREKFVNEAKMLATFMNEPGIVSVYRFFRANNTAYIVMEYVEGITLKDFLKKKEKLSIDEIVGIIGPVMNSLARIHEKNLLHRDISPDNIMITPKGAGKLIDFGAAREVNGGNKSLSVVLKHGFSPVEQYQVKGNQGPWTDVYALGATIYRCVTGVIPPDAIDRMMDDTYKSAYMLEPGCNRLVSDVIDKALEIKIDARYQSVGEFKTAFFSALYSVENKTNTAITENNTSISLPSLERKSDDNDEVIHRTIEKGNAAIPQQQPQKGNANGSRSKAAVLIALMVSLIIALIVGFVIVSNKKSMESDDLIATATLNENVTDSLDNSYDNDLDTIVIESEESVSALNTVEESSEEAIASVNAEDEYLLDSLDKIAVANIGDYVILGHYEQDGDSSNGKEDIVWRVLDKTDSKALLISAYGLDSVRYNQEKVAITWEDSYLRQWLNSSFYNDAFEADEQKYILEDLVVAEDNSKYNIDAGNDTYDKVFCLSISEAKKYFSSDEDRLCEPTEYALEQGSWISTNPEYPNKCWWKLRSPGHRQDMAACVLNDGSVDDFDGDVSYDNGTVRPSVWIDISDF